MSLFDLTANSNGRKLVYMNPNFPNDVTIKSSDGSATFSAVIEKDGRPKKYKYQWFVDGQPIDGADTETYTRDVSGDKGQYKVWCEVSNAAGTTRTKEAVLTVNRVPILDTSYPQDVTVVVHNSVTCTVLIAEAGFPESYTYQWYKDGNEVDGATSDSYTFTPDTVGELKLYCDITNSGGKISSRTVTVNVIPLYLYNAGDENTSLTGGWTSVDGPAYYNKGITKNDSDIYVQILHYDARNHEESLASTSKAVSTKGYTKLRIVVSNFKNTNSNGVAKTDNVCRFGLYSSSISSLSSAKNVTGNGTIDLDISAYQGNYYVFFGCCSEWRDVNASDYCCFTVTSVQLV